MLTVVILTRNEERHIARSISSVAGIADRIFVADSGSMDRTIVIAKEFGAEVRYNPWVNYATQFNWALDQLGDDTEWVLRLDADEIVTDELATEILTSLPKLGATIDAVYVPRRMTFMGGEVAYGGVFPVRVLRLFRAGHGRCENRWMDEHIIVEGEAVNFSGELIDDNHNYLTWWIDKHNAYASREVVDLLNLEFGFIKHETVADLCKGQQAGVKRWFKEHLYARLPIGSRAILYFLYRFVLRLGFLDGREGRTFHLLQGFWYRYLVDIKLHQVKAFMRDNSVDVVEAIREVLDIELGDSAQSRVFLDER